MLQLDYTFFLVLVGTLFMGLSSGILSCYAVLRQQSLFGDAIAHATLPGICLAFIITKEKASWVLLTGALIWGALAMYLIQSLIDYSRLKADAAIGVVLSVFFGFGVLLLTLIQKMPLASQSGLENYLFGYTAGLLIEDIYLMAGISIVILVVVLSLWKEFKLLTFDSTYAATLGAPIKRLTQGLLALLTLSIIAGLQSVGIILMTAMLIAPGTAARQWTHKFSVMMILSITFAMLSACIGVTLSSMIDHLPTGPCIVVVVSCLAGLSLLLGTKKGIFLTYIRQQWQRRNISKESILQQLFILANTHNDPRYPHEFDSFRLFGKRPTQQALKKLRQEGLVYKSPPNRWGLSSKGHQKALTLLKKQNTS
ncbi:MAG: metal ABC transporter permease [bacterium]